MIQQLLMILKKPSSWLMFFLWFLLIVAISFFLPQYSVILGLFDVFSLTDARLWTSLCEVILQGLLTMSVMEQVLFWIFCITTALNLVVFGVYLRMYRKLFVSGSAHMSFWGLLLGVLSFGCLSCGVVLLVPLVSIIGVGGVSWISHHRDIIYIFALILVFSSLYFLLKKLNDPQVCEPVLNKS